MSESAHTESDLRRDFIRVILADYVEAKQQAGRGEAGAQVVTRFPPEPNGYLHIGHAKAISLNFTVAQEFDGRCHLRFDDTNPAKEEVEYAEAIQEDIRWLGFDWKDHLYHASDYFDRLYEYAVELIRNGKAYVDHLSAEQIREYRGTLTEPGRNSPYRDRSVEENLALFEKMRQGEFVEGECVLRAKIDMASPNMNLRDPALYRVKKEIHHRTGDCWCIYPMYDFAHTLSDAIEGITHSLCSLEFENHRPLYEWFLENLELPSDPRQIEFARMNLTYTVMSKRKLLKLVEQGIVDGWNDPRMPTLAGYRRRGYTPCAIRKFCEIIGMNKVNSVIDMALLEHTQREDLNKTAPRFMAVLNPLKVVIENYPEGQTEQVEAVNNPEDPEAGKRKVPFSRELYIEREDFREDAPRKFFRLAPGKEVRLRYAYYITCTDVVKDDNGEIVELRCTYDPESRGGGTPDGRKVKGTLHWVCARHARNAEIRLYDHLFAKPAPEDFEPGGSFLDNLNPASKVVVEAAKVEPAAMDLGFGLTFQFERQGYFCVDSVDSTDSHKVFNRTVALRDSWAKVEKAEKKQKQKAK